MGKVWIYRYYMKTLKKYWLMFPVWLRKVLVASLETSVLAFLVYLGNVLDRGQSFQFNAALLVFLKAFVQGLRNHPDFPLPDYVNLQK